LPLHHLGKLLDLAARLAAGDAADDGGLHRHRLRDGEGPLLPVLVNLLPQVPLHDGKAAAMVTTRIATIMMTTWVDRRCRSRRRMRALMASWPLVPAAVAASLLGVSEV
jgi:hypothetical protein